MRAGLMMTLIAIAAASQLDGLQFAYALAG